jgi:hypothetical protein
MSAKENEKFMDGAKKKINGNVIFAAILIVAVGLSVGLPLGLKGKGLVTDTGWDKAVNATLMEYGKDTWNIALEITVIQRTELSEKTTVHELYADGDKYKNVKREYNGTEAVDYAAKENEKWYSYEYSEDLNGFEKIEEDGGYGEKMRENLKKRSGITGLQLLKGAYSAFERKDGKYFAKDMKRLSEVMSAFDAENGILAFTFRNGKLKELYIELADGDHGYMVEIIGRIKYTFGGVKVDLPT